jgi:hypothetical protein
MTGEIRKIPTVDNPTTSSGDDPTAISNEDRARRTDDYIDTDLAREANTPVTMIAVLLVGFVLAALVGWYVLGKDMSGSVGATRTSPPISSSPTDRPEHDYGPQAALTASEAWLGRHRPRSSRRLVVMPL